MGDLDLTTGVIIPYINFLIFFVLALKFFKKPLMGMIATRREDYEALLAKAESAKLEALEQKKALDLKFKDLEKNLAEIKDSIKLTAQSEAEDIIRNAKDLAAHMEAEATKLAEAKVRDAQLELRKQIMGMVAEKVTTKLKTEVDDGRHQQLLSNKIVNLSEFRGEA